MRKLPGSFQNIFKQSTRCAADLGLFPKHSLLLSHNQTWLTTHAKHRFYNQTPQTNMFIKTCWKTKFKILKNKNCLVISVLSVKLSPAEIFPKFTFSVKNNRYVKIFQIFKNKNCLSVYFTLSVNSSPAEIVSKFTLSVENNHSWLIWEQFEFSSMKFLNFRLISRTVTRRDCPKF